MRDTESARGGIGTTLGVALAAAGAASAAWAWAWATSRRDEEARTTHRALVDLLLNALTADDPVTARHSRRVADLAFALAQAGGMPRRELATLRMAALLHDMGKIDDRFWHIVHSRQPLTPEQRDQIKYHPHLSARILEPLEKIHPGIQEIVASHHECWDGSGYPAGLAECDIPLGARIITVADVFDAMTQPRKYRDPLPVEEALAELRRGAGRQFDPALVERAESYPVAEQWAEIARNGLVDEVRREKQEENGDKPELELGTHSR